MTLPKELLRAVSSPEGGKIAIITGAGCSLEPPTGLPLAWKCSEDAHERLVKDHVLEDGDCTDPFDLSLLAEVVTQKTGSQKDLVLALPIPEFRNAKANTGHKVAVALVVEGAVSNIVTLNFDLAFSHALSELGIRNEVAVLNGPEDHEQMSQRNIIYLHRSAESPHEQWILTKESLDHAWKNGWEESIARFATFAPVTVFAGLGSSCGVLTYSAHKLRSALGNRATLLMANPGDPNTSRFAKEVGIAPENCVRCGWVEFMSLLADRFVQKVIYDVRNSGQEQAVREKWATSSEKYKELLEPILIPLHAQLSQLGLLGLGKLRAAWFLEFDRYTKTDEQQIGALADLILALAFVLHQEPGSACFSEDGTVSIATRAGTESKVMLVSGWRKQLRWTSLETSLSVQSTYQSKGKMASKKVLASGVTGTKPSRLATPTKITGSPSRDDIIDAGGGMTMWSVDELREDPSKVQELFT